MLWVYAKIGLPSISRLDILMFISLWHSRFKFKTCEKQQKKKTYSTRRWWHTSPSPRCWAGTASRPRGTAWHIAPWTSFPSRRTCCRPTSWSTRTSCTSTALTKTKKDSFHFSAFAWKYSHGGLFQVSALFCQLQTPETSSKQIENKYIKAFRHDTLILYERKKKKRNAASKVLWESLKMDNSDIKKGATKNILWRSSYIAP